jgi:hypothetical protein
MVAHPLSKSWSNRAQGSSLDKMWGGTHLTGCCRSSQTTGVDGAEGFSFLCEAETNNEMEGPVFLSSRSLSICLNKTNVALHHLII